MIWPIWVTDELVIERNVSITIDYGINIINVITQLITT